MYLNDILIYSKTEEEHVQYVSQVLQTLQNTELQVKLEKSAFYIHKVDYLGYIISDKGAKMDPKNIHVIKEWPILKNISEVLFFLGFANLYYRFIKEYSKITTSLTISEYRVYATGMWVKGIN